MIKKGDEKFLSTLIIVAVIISITGTFFSLKMLNDLDYYKQYFSGHVSVGQINLTITQNLTISVVQNVINFSMGFVNTGADGATLNTTTAGSLIAPANWTNSTLYDPRAIQISNDGNVNATVNLTSAKTAATFLGGTVPTYEFNGSNKEANSCNNGGTLAGYTSLNADQQIVCANLGSNDLRDEIYLHCRIWVPADTQGTKEDTWTFTATAVN